nr:MAG TPA: hypothetical protein [Bacteriophage sp.]
MHCYNHARQRYWKQAPFPEILFDPVQRNRENACLVSEITIETEGTAWQFKFKKPNGRWHVSKSALRAVLAAARHRARCSSAMV